MNADTLTFTTYCVGNLADALHLSAAEVYGRLRRSGILDDYILRCYDVLHTFPRQYIVDDLIDCMREKGVLP